MERDTILILDFGGQYKQLIARRVRECQVYCEILPYTTALEELKSRDPKGIILTGGPSSVYDPASPTCDSALFSLGVPVLGICYGSQLMAHLLDGRVQPASVSEYGRTELTVDAADSVLFTDVPESTVCWMSHTDRITALPDGFRATAHTADCPVAAMEDADRRLYATQFHPEVEHTPQGADMLRRFVRDVCGCRGDWHMASFVEEQIPVLRERVGKGRVLLALSGGVDSSVTAALLSRAVGKQLICVFVDHGLMRKNEGAQVRSIFGPEGGFDLNYVHVDAKDRFYAALQGVSEPEQKRRIIGEQFIRVFEETARSLGTVEYLAQGTIYPDVVESGVGSGGATIKSHHNVGGLPKDMGFRGIVEPLRMLFKDEVRALGTELGLPQGLLYRQPFPGPGLGVRIMGAITPDKVRIVQEADAIFQEELRHFGIDTGRGQFFAALTDMRSVGVMGDHRTYDCAVVLRAVLTSDFMTATATRLPYELLETAMNRIVNTVPGVNRVLYDLTSKPPATIELE